MRTSCYAPTWCWQVQFEMFEGVDAGSIGKPHLAGGVDAVQGALGCVIYRDWAITDEFDLLRVCPELCEQCCSCLRDELSAERGLTGTQVWEEYHHWHNGWHKRHAHALQHAHAVFIGSGRSTSNSSTGMCVLTHNCDVGT